MNFFYYIIRLLVFAVIQCNLSYSHTIKELKGVIFNNYDKSVGPFNENGIFRVRITVTRTNMDYHHGEFRGRLMLHKKWTDIRLKWTSDFEEINSIHVHTDDVWVPEFIPLHENNTQASVFYSLESFNGGILEFNGDTNILEVIEFVTHCETNEYKWPNDIQICSLKFGVKASSGISVLKCVYGRHKYFGLSSLEKNQYWKLLNSQEIVKNKTGNFNQILELRLTFQRIGFVYVIILLLPGITVMFTTLVLLWVNPRNPHRLVILGVFFVLQSYILRLIADQIPHSGIKPPLIGTYFVTGLLVTLLCIIETVAVRLILMMNMSPLWLQNIVQTFLSINILGRIYKSNVKRVQLLYEEDEESEYAVTSENSDDSKKTENSKDVVLFTDFITFILVTITYLTLLYNIVTF